MSVGTKTRRADNVSVKEAAERLNVHQDTIRAGLITGSLPIGSAVKCKINYSYIIPRERLDKWENGNDLSSVDFIHTIMKKLDDISSQIVDIMKEKNASDSANTGSGQPNGIKE